MENEKLPITERILTEASKWVSAIFQPLFIPLMAFMALFLFTYLQIMPQPYKLFVLGIVCCFTILLPITTAYLYVRINGAVASSAERPGRRVMPYLLGILSFIFCAIIMYRLRIPWYMNGIILASILIMIVFLLANIKWRVSIHAGGAGAVIGGIISFAALFGYNPVWLLCVFILIAGMVGSARIILGKHTLNEVLSGFTIGLVCAVMVLHPTSNTLFRHLLF
ncbi:hypothetical protein LJC21_03640 [Bacteroides sp. OttesenSCG-928-E20]|nr:hypothetical protein [Bacteroides sp. OttesenSCG-928-N06]MDL2299780.1 hypothetical protein [Bacteroides sp. OttesenSCG-928-E20]